MWVRFAISYGKEGELASLEMADSKFYVNNRLLKDGRRWLPLYILQLE